MIVSGGHLNVAQPLQGAGLKRFGEHEARPSTIAIVQLRSQPSGIGQRSIRNGGWRELVLGGLDETLQD